MELTGQYKHIIQRLDECNEHISDHISAGLDGLLLYLGHIIEEAVYQGVTRALTEIHTAGMPQER
jgi:hypothetical protein